MAEGRSQGRGDECQTRDDGSLKRERDKRLVVGQSNGSQHTIQRPVRRVKLGIAGTALVGGDLGRLKKFHVTSIRAYQAGFQSGQDQSRDERGVISPLVLRELN